MEGKKEIMLEEIMNMKEDEIRTYMDRRGAELCERDVTAVLEMMGVDEEIIEFKNPIVKSIYDGKIEVDKLGTTPKDYWVNIEFETNGAKNYAILKQNIYAIKLHAKYKVPIKSIMIVPTREKLRIVETKFGPNSRHSILVCPFYAIDGDEQLKIIRYKNKHKPRLNRYDILFLNFALFTKYSMEPHEMLLEVSKLVEEANINETVRQQLKVLHELDCLTRIEEKYQLL